MTDLPRIAVSMGDPAGVGPELCLRLLAAESVLAQCVPIIFGDASILRRVAGQCSLQQPEHIVPISQIGPDTNQPSVADLGVLDDPSSVEPGKIDAACGLAARLYIEAAADATVSNQVAALTTCPINKEAMHLAEVPYPGHTELLAAITNTKRFCMMLASDKITVSLATTHIGLDDVCAQLSVQRITDVIHLTADVMSRLRGRPARIVVCGLNPHAGEHGVLGHGEEEEVILPAVTEAKQNGIDIVGPLPPDTAFLPGRLRTTDAFVCMYHDQGLIPLKMLSFDSAINVTLGLPIVRTSPAHGTAFDIAWNGSASPESLIRAVLLAARLSRADAGP